MLKHELQKIENLARDENYNEAWQLLERMTAENSQEYRVWTTHAYVHSRQGETEIAIEDLSKAISLCDKEPDPFYTRGILFFQRGSYRDAISDFTSVIKLCDYHKSDYYREGAYFFRADSYVKVGEFEKARSDCAHIASGMRTWTDKLKTKEDILSECS
ncbi:MAG TPA: hypothetical protein VH597_14840 [Verrucomicrobiae bacterium]|jgi:tetratricopeptide (TPR) repeat protein|nr:hypothetical protein [Verrucomicrobiae bacterium]